MLVEPRTSISPPIRKAVATSADTASPITRDSLDENRDEQLREAWQLIEDKLIEWGRHPHEFDEDGITTPSGETIRLAIQLAAKLSQPGFAAPTRVVPDAHGGIVFELQSKDVLESMHVQPDGSIEHRVFKDHRLVLREPWMLKMADNE